MFQLVDQATKLGEARHAMDVAKSDKEKEAQHLVGLLYTQMVKIPDENWWDYTMEAMGLVRRYQQPRVPTPQPVQQQIPTCQPDYYMPQQQMMQQQQPTYAYKPPTPQNVPPMRRQGISPSASSSQPGTPGFGQLPACSGFYPASPGYPNLLTPQVDPLPTRPLSRQASHSSQPTGSGQSSTDKETEEATQVLSDVMNQSLSEFLPN
jgi:hypothetical protein